MLPVLPLPSLLSTIYLALGLPNIFHLLLQAPRELVEPIQTHVKPMIIMTKPPNLFNIPLNYQDIIIILHLAR